MARTRLTFDPIQYAAMIEVAELANRDHPHDNPRFLNSLIVGIFTITGRIYGAGFYLKLLRASDVSRMPSAGTVQKTIERVRQENATLVHPGYGQVQHMNLVRLAMSHLNVALLHASNSRMALVDAPPDSSVETAATMRLALLNLYSDASRVLDTLQAAVALMGDAPQAQRERSAHTFSGAEAGTSSALHQH